MLMEEDNTASLIGLVADREGRLSAEEFCIGCVRLWGMLGVRSGECRQVTCMCTMDDGKIRYGCQCIRR